MDITQQLDKCIKQTSRKALADYLWVTEHAVMAWIKKWIIPHWHKKKVIEWLEWLNDDNLNLALMLSDNK